MVYNTFIHNKRELDYIFERKLFKKHIFHNDNIEEEYYWDDYDTTYVYKMNTPPNCPTPISNKVVTQIVKSRHIPKITNRPICLHNNEQINILKTRLSHTDKSVQTNNSSVQTNKSVCVVSTQTNKSVNDASSQTSPKFYFPTHRFNLNVDLFNTNLRTR